MRKPSKGQNKLLFSHRANALPTESFFFVLAQCARRIIPNDIKATIHFNATVHVKSTLWTSDVLSCLPPSRTGSYFVLNVLPLICSPTTVPTLRVLADRRTYLPRANRKPTFTVLNILQTCSKLRFENVPPFTLQNVTDHPHSLHWAFTAAKN